jgi:hypothetical protein
LVCRPGLVAVGGAEDVPVKREEGEEQAGEGDERKLYLGDDADLAEPDGNSGVDSGDAEEDGDSGEDVQEDEVFVKGGGGRE